jgi:hypothetical protein
VYGAEQAAAVDAIREDAIGIVEKVAHGLGEQVLEHVARLAHARLALVPQDLADADNAQEVEHYPGYVEDQGQRWH